ncbi:MAG: efflux RND transporter periplasmic adaptor subunit [Desulfohalobiaceae bacterium]|nr:efflux RND transporter periplasmic adaptor subunit [Desulfohalobiaceae bacterium]
MRKRIFLTVLIAAMLAATGIFIVYGLPSDKTETGQQSKQQKPALVKAVFAHQSTLSRRLVLNGSVEPYRLARLASPAEGPVENIGVREGDRVKAGQALLFIGRKKGAEALIASLREEVKKEEDELSRTRQLCESEALPGEQLDQARLSFEKARAQLVQAKESFGDYTITAPWDGVVSCLEVKEGQFAAPRTLLMEMYDPESLVIRAAVPERQAAEIKIGLRVDIRLDAYPGETVQGRITRAYPYLDSRLRTRTIEIVPDKPLDLLPGMFARLQVLLKTVDQAVVVQKDAVLFTPEGEAVFVVEDGKAIKRRIKTGIEEENRIQIVSGVLAGDSVVIAGNRKLKSGAAVRLIKKDKPEKGGFRDVVEPTARQQPKSKTGVGRQ